jgi:hypothetical protein
MPKKKNKTNNDNRFRCLVTGCNPVLFGQTAATEHFQKLGHRTAKWPVRSAEGERRAQARNKSGYYDKYNVGPKARSVRLGGSPTRETPPSAPVPYEEWCGDDWDIWGNEYAWGEDDF